jgi:hypothetical protein
VPLPQPHLAEIKYQAVANIRKIHVLIVNIEDGPKKIVTNIADSVLPSEKTDNTILLVYDI